MDDGYIFLAIVMLVGQITLMWMWQHHWFKRENFKIEKANTIAINRLELRKLEKDMGLSKTKTILPKAQPSTMETLSSLAPLLSKLNPDTIDMLADKFLGTGSNYDVAEGAEGNDLGSMITDFALKNPEMIKGFMEGVGKNKQPPGATDDVISQV